MAREFQLPDVGEGISEGEIVRWLVDVGDQVEEDQPVVEVETDKALVEIPSPVNGTVAEIRAEEGELVPVGTVIVVFEVDGEAGAAAEPEADSAEVAGEPTDAEGEGPAGGESESETADATAAGGDGEAPAGRVFAPPHVRRLARELGVDLATVSGSGPGGRVTDADVRAAAGGQPAEPPGEEGPDGAPATADAGAGTEPSTEAPARAPKPGGAGPSVGTADRERTLAAPATRRVARELDVDLDAVPAVEERDGEAFVTEAAVREYAEAQTAAQAADAGAVAAGEAGPREERVAYRGVRRTIGDRMSQSKFTAPHVTHHDTVAVPALVEAREQLKPRAEERGISLTYLPFVMKAVVAALEEHPYMNASLDEEAGEIVLKHHYDIGVAVATDAGLMVPVVDDVDGKGLLQIASEVNELASKARERTIGPDELRGSTFSITNFGAIGGEYATPIINYPEVAILGLGGIAERPVVEDGEVVARPTIPLSLTIDHRVVDGAEAAEFTNRVMETLANPTLLLLE